MGTMFEKSLIPMMTKMEERMQMSIDKSIQRIQKDNRTTQQDTAKKLEALTEAICNIANHLETNPSVNISRAPTPAVSPPPVLPPTQKMTEQFRAKNFSGGIESVCPHSLGLTTVVRFAG
jgi:hypothetical protein